MAVNKDYLKYVQDQLSEFGDVEIKRMFGGIGGDIFRLKVDETNQKDYEEKGVKPFHSEKKKKGMPYWDVPQDILDDRSELAKWANKSFEIARKTSNK